MGTTTADGEDAHVRVEQNILVADARNGSIAALRSSQRNCATGTLDDEQYDGAGWLGERRQARQPPVNSRVDGEHLAKRTTLL